jgi:hypothetical protein
MQAPPTLALSMLQVARLLYAHDTTFPDWTTQNWSPPTGVLNSAGLLAQMPFWRFASFWQEAGST